MTNQPTTIDAYLAQWPDDIRKRLESIREVIRATAPEASEAMSYQMPTYQLYGNLVHFAAFKNHIGFYPAPSGIVSFSEALSHYKSAKGSVQFPHSEPLPLSLIEDIVRFRVQENTTLAEAKRHKAKGRAK